MEYSVNAYWYQYRFSIFLKALKDQFEGNVRLRFHLAPPLLARKNKQGIPQKMTLPGWTMAMFRGLASLRFLRGGPLDVFGLTQERKRERQLIVDYRSDVEKLLANLDDENFHCAIKILSLPEKIRGYGHVKLANINMVEAEQKKLMREFRNGGRAYKQVELVH